ncbi:FxSxx-COOH system tetratricopeptide repeat protein [Paractinoplanes lichenicola]|uniref:Tetratricopeptide repeat protein n=1 Tax=Paractinoplanes lichenicola TaxID=2802976 RepID=A0ABS1VUV6_9ACTN|nr:FxSxx-COOH system tetratricopeptide repeat protein [Actinoplanes lichenicola]MBL7258262.1 tetratricopeptide repeat protein [Actinoplanes lichenicola]
MEPAQRRLIRAPPAGSSRVDGDRFMMDGPPPSVPPPDTSSAPENDTRPAAVVVLDDDPALEFWSAEIDELQESLQDLGVFSSVESRRLTFAPGGQPALADSADNPRALRSGPQAVFLVTPGRSLDPLLELITDWARNGLVAVVNLLPQQHWRDRGFRITDATWTPSDPPGPTAATPWHVSGLDLRSAEEKQRDSTRTAVPILERGREWLDQWARLLDRSTGSPVTTPAVLLSPDDSTRSSGRQLSAAMLVARFRTTASPQAFALATRLAAAPLNLRTMRALQRTALRSGPAHLTEVLTSNLLLPPKHGRRDGDTNIVYEFVYGVREQLLSLAYRDRTIEVQHVVEHELERDVEAVRNLTLRVREPRRAAYLTVNHAALPYLRVELAVHVALGGPNLNAAQQLSRKIGTPVPMQARRTSLVLPSSRMESAMSETIPSQGSSSPFSAAGSGLHYGQDREDGTVPTVTEGLRTTQRHDARPPAVTNNLPMRNPTFTGRRDLLDALHQRLRAGTTAVLPEALHGAGGVGKSQLVIEYVHLHKQDFDLIWWIPAERSAQIQNSLTELASSLELPVQSTANTAVPAVLEALRVGRPFLNWLLVFDNAEDPEDVERFFPKGGPGSIIVTSRNARWGGIANTLAVDVFDRQESIELMRRRDPRLAVGDADRLAERLGDLPLAIEAAAAWRAEMKMTADEYLSRLESSQPELDEEAAVGDLDYPEHVAAVWNISLNGLHDLEPSTLRLLQLCAFFAPEPISKVLLSKPRGLRIHPDLDPLMRNSTGLNQAIGTIGKLALARIDYRTNSLQMHRLVQRVLIHQMDAETRDAMRHGAHLLLAGNDPDQPDDSLHWGRYAELYPHIIASRAERCLDEMVRDTILNESKYLWRWGDHDEARNLAQRAYDALLELGDETHPDSLRMAQWLGSMHFVNGSYAEAAALNARTLELYRQSLGDDQEETLNAIGAVAADHRVAGDFAGALELSLTVYERSNAKFGEGLPFTLRAAHNLAVSMRLSGLFGRALKLDEQRYAGLVQIYGTDHSESLSTSGGINLDRRELGDYVAAHRNQENVVAEARRVLKFDDHPDVLRQSHDLASFRRKAGQLQQALELSSDVLRRYRSRYGDKRPETVLALLTVSIDQRVTGDLGAAREAGEAAVAGLRELYGETHPHTAGAKSDLAVTLRLLGEYDAARALDEQALRELKDRLSSSHALVISARINLASDLYELGDFEGAHKLDSESYAQCADLLGDGHPTTLACGVNLAMDLRGLGRDSEASSLFSETMEKFRTGLGEDHPATAAAAAGVRANCDIDPLPL